MRNLRNDNNSSQLVCNGSVKQQTLLDNINARQAQNECSGELQHICVNSTSTNRDLGGVFVLKFYRVR